MKLQRATTITRLNGERDDNMGLFRTREERQERREERRERRAARKAARLAKRRARRDERLERKEDKLRAKVERIEERQAEPTRRERRLERREERREDRQERRAERRGEPVRRRTAVVAPMPGYPQGYPQDPGYIAPPDGYDDGSLAPEDDAPPMEEGEAELEPAEPSAEGVGWSWPRRRNTVTQAAPALPVAARPQGARPQAAAAQVPAPWSPPARMGPHMRIQASAGYRAAVVELRPGLFVVAEIPAQVAQSEMGFLPLLAPLMMRSAARGAQQQGQAAQAPLYVQQPDGTFAPAAPQPERRGLLSAFRRQPVAALPGPVAQPQAWNTAPTPWQQPVAALPGPVAQAAPPTEPAPEAPVSGPLVVAVPRIARWAAAEDVAGVLADPRYRGGR